VRIAATLLILAATAATGAEVYVSTDANGVITYSDRPESQDAQPLIVASARPARPAARPVAAPPGVATAAATAANPGDPNAGVQAEEDPKVAADRKAKNCEVARSRQANYSTARRLYKQTEGGEREYLSDSDIDKARAQADADVKAWCD
jgi:uncharacterized protein DUF4124